MSSITEQIEQRAQELLNQLTLDEKMGMMDADTPLWSGFMEMMGGAYNAHPWPAGVVERLGIPGILFTDGPRGVILEGGTTFPVSMARGAAWDVDLEERIGDVIGRELRALGANFFGGICINLLRHPAWGRAQETYGEDPYHLGEFGAALTRGVQRHAMACAKHYALNSMENARFQVDVQISPRALHEIYLPHFKRCVDEGVAAIMSAYNSANGEWCGQDEDLLDGILKEQWGFEGFVLTDFIFGMRDAKKAALGGQDLEMPFQFHYHNELKTLVESGEVPVDVVDDSVLRLLRKQLAIPAAENYDPSMAGKESSRALAREAAQKSMVLLQNNLDLLPLRDVQKVAVLGRLADMPNTGDGGSSNTQPVHVVTPLEGIQAALADKAAVVHDDAGDLEKARAVAKDADVAILIVGYTDEDEGEFIGPETFQKLMAMFPQPQPEDMPYVQALTEGMAAQDAAHEAFAMPPGGDRDSLALRPEDVALIEAVAAVQPRTIVAIMSGSAVIVENWREMVPTILMIWYPGMEGGHALADVLLGKVNPSGKLPFVVAKSVADYPFFDKNAPEITYDLWHGYRMLERDDAAPAFPFGYGLSYTTYGYDNLKLIQSELDAAGILEISFDVTNTGQTAGEEISQVYISAVDSAVERAVKELKAFTRTAVEPGETVTVTLELPLSRLAYYDESQEQFIVEATAYDLFVGAHSLDQNALTARFSANRT